MRDRMAKNVIEIGMLGIPDVENDPVVRALQAQQRMRLSAAFSPVYAIVEAFSRRNQVSPFGSLRSLVEHPRIQGLIWNERFTGIDQVRWALGTEPKPILVRSQFWELCSMESLVQIRNHAAAEHVVVLVELLHRWTPTTLRLRELIATEMGPIHEICLTIRSGIDHASLVQFIDWIRMLLALREVSVVPQHDNQTINMEFARQNGSIARCRLNLQSDSQLKSLSTTSVSSISQIICEGGTVEITSENDLKWRTSSGWIVEHLASDRSATDVMLDLFGRRIAGGIVPVPDINELLRSERLVAAIRNAQATGNSICFDDASTPIDNSELRF